MLQFTKAKTFLIWAVCLLGVLLSIPSLVGPGRLPDWLPQRHVNLGLDLQGGSYLLLEVDTAAVERERLESALDGVRKGLRAAGIRFTDLGVHDTAVTFAVADPEQAANLQDALKELLAERDSNGGPEYELKVSEGRASITLPQAALTDRIQRAVAQSIEIVRRRIDETGVNEPVIARQGTSRILVQLPGVSDPARIKRLLGTTAKMTFHLVAEEAAGATTVAPPGTEWLESGDRARPGERYLIRKKVEVDGANLTDAQPAADSQTGQWVVNFTFDSVGARRFADVTRANVRKPFAIVLDGKVISAPVIQEPITGGRGRISGNFTAQSANDLAVLLRAGALPAPLTIVEERSVGPELGADSIKAGLISVAVGFVLVVAYMAMTYGLFGLFANIALIFNLFLTLAALSMLEATLTLPGIAGILLTLGMSVDANILINERIREEVRKGRQPVSAMQAGFSKAFATILDSNLTTLIKMVILYSVGTGTVRGFAVTISLGILTSMFTATVVSRWLIAYWYKVRRPKTLPLGWLRLAPDDMKVPFMKGRNAGLAFSVVLSVASIALFIKPGLNYGVDFAGGIVVEIRTEQPANFAAIRHSLEKLNVGTPALQQFGPPTDVIIRLENPPGGDGAQQQVVKNIQATLQQDFPGTTIRRVEAVGASVSGELFHQGMMALGLAAIAMLAYIWFRFEWQFGVGAVVTMLLDVTKTVGFFALLGLQFNLTSIAAILTIMGYSINDKVVVYDRVRENLRLYRKMPLRELIDRSINETMGRTIGTSLSIFLATLPLALFGGEALREFAWVLLFGVVLATSSSIFIAAPILLYLGEHRLRRPSGDDAAAREEGAPAGGRRPAGA
jgi:SecD/SecF fusion protein